MINYLELPVVKDDGGREYVAAKKTEIYTPVTAAVTAAVLERV